jgi:hypothetical protein
MERETGFEPATSTLARSHSTTELLPLSSRHYKRGVIDRQTAEGNRFAVRSLVSYEQLFKRRRVPRSGAVDLPDALSTEDPARVRQFHHPAYG